LNVIFLLVFTAIFNQPVSYQLPFQAKAYL
jgi:hypothetical protein